MEKKVIFVFFAFTVVLFWNLGTTYLTNWDEAWYADISRNIAQKGDLFKLYWNKELFFEKPPLYFWLTALMFKLFGISEFSVRLPSVLSALGVAIVLFFFAKEFFNTSIGYISLFVLFSSPQFLYRSRTGNLDTMLTLWMFLATFAFYKGYAKNSKWFLLMGIALGLGFLTKGVIALFPLLPFLLFLTIKRELGLVRKAWFLIGLFLTLLLSAGWMLFSLSINGTEFLKQFFVSNTEKFGLSTILKNFSFDYLFFLKNGLKIWFPMLLISILLVFYRRRDKDIFLPFLYFVLFFLLISFVSNKSNWFILPIYPMGALLVGFAVYELWWKFLRRGFLFLFLCIMAIAAIQNSIYRDEYIVPNIAGDEARVALTAKNLMREDDILYLTNYYYPTTVYYSERKVYAVYSEQNSPSWWILKTIDWPAILKNDRVFILTTQEELGNLNMYFSKQKFEILFRSGQKLLLKKV